MSLRSELAALDDRFVIDTRVVEIGGWRVELAKPRNADDLISEADFAKDDRLPYWADLWPSAEVLASHLVRVGARGAGEPSAAPRALEFGCGVGLVTVAAMRAGYAVTATDYYDDALQFTARNAAANLGAEPTTRLVDWRSLPADLGTYELVLAADVLYERPYSVMVAAAVAQTLARSGVALIADQGRVGLEAFLTETERRGLHHRTLREERPSVGPPGDLQAPGPTVTLYELRWRN